MSLTSPDNARRAAFLAAILTISILFAALRQYGIGHLLVWDEAMQLLTVRSFLAGNEDYFSGWFWRHPPLFSLLMTLTGPETSDFAERTQHVAMAFALANLVILSLMAARSHGVLPAIFASICLALMPGAVFFDTWIKADAAVATFGLLGILTAPTRPFICGACIAIAFLFKETALFYFPACIAIAWSRSSSPWNAVRRVAAAAGPAVLAVACWYPLAWLTQGNFTYIFGLGHLKFALASDGGWSAPWHYYLSELLLILGLPGVVLLAIGTIAPFIRRVSDRDKADSTALPTYWPLAIVVPALVFLSLLPAKVPWILISLLPPLAMIEGLGAAACIRAARSIVGLVVRRRTGLLAEFPAFAAAFAVSASLVPAAIAALDYEAFLMRLAPGQWLGAMLSRANARAVSALVADDDRFLITSFHYWKGLTPAAPCPVFTYYMTRRPLVLIEDNDAPFERLAAKAAAYQIDWALLSPEPGPREYEVYDGFSRKLGCPYIPLHRAFLFRVKSGKAGGADSLSGHHVPEPDE